MIRMRDVLFRQSWFKIGSTFCGVVLCSFLLTACAKTNKSANSIKELSLTPITKSPTNICNPGKIVWHDLLTPNIAAAKEFYGTLFGWTFQQEELYSVILNEGHPIGGILERDLAKPAWLGSMSVADVDRAVEYTLAKGGKVLTGPLDIENRGRGVLISDPQGAHLVLLHADGGDPIDGEPAINAWLWNEIWSRSPENAFTFYKGLGGYDSSIQKDAYKILVSQEKWRCGLRTVEKEDQWVPIVRVADLEATAAKVTALGGTVWIGPGEDSGDEDSALISDDAGALLMIQRWSSQPETEGQ